MSALEGRTVVITGASTGIGEACARHFDAEGASVFAGVRKDADGERLREGSSDRLRPINLDVTDAAQIDAAFAEIGAAVGDRGLDGLVNNAGVARGGPLEFLTVDEWRDQFEINVFGQVAVTQRAISLIRPARGRIVFIGSIASRVSTPFMAPYAASKHAVAAVAEALRHELRPWGIKVSLVEPGVIATDIWGKGRETLARLDEELPPEAHELYGSVFDDFRSSIDKNDGGGIPAIDVARKVGHALTSARPKARYLVGSDAVVAGYADRLLPDVVMDVMVERFG